MKNTFNKKYSSGLVALVATVLFVVSVLPAFAQNVGEIVFVESYPTNSVTAQPANTVRNYEVKCPIGYYVTQVYTNIRRGNAGNMGYSLSLAGSKIATTTISNTQLGHWAILPTQVACLGSSTLQLQIVGDQLWAISEGQSFLGYPASSTVQVINTASSTYLRYGLKLVLPLSISSSSESMSSTTISQGLSTTNEVLVSVAVMIALLASLLTITLLTNIYYRSKIE